MARRGGEGRQGCWGRGGLATGHVLITLDASISISTSSLTREGHNKTPFNAGRGNYTAGANNREDVYVHSQLSPGPARQGNSRSWSSGGHSGATQAWGRSHLAAYSSLVRLGPAREASEFPHL